MELVLSLSSTLYSSSSSLSSKQSSSSLSSKQSSCSIRTSTKFNSTKLLWSLKHQTGRTCFVLRCTAVQDNPVAVVVNEEEAESVEEDLNQKKKLYLFNLPWSLTVSDIKTLFKECGHVIDVEIIKQKDGRSRGFAFVTMASGDEAQAVLDKFHQTELSGRRITVQFAKRFKKPTPPPLVAAPSVGERRHKLYVSNLAWQVRSSHLRQVFSTSFEPLSTRVIFDTPKGRSSGYGFVSFATKEEADRARSELDGTELLGRAIRLTLSDRNIDTSETEKSVESDKEKKDVSEEQQPEDHE